MEKIDWNDKEQRNAWRRENYQKNREKINKQGKLWYKNNKDKIKKYRDSTRFGGNRDLVFKRDNYKCQECGMTQEQHFFIHGFDLNIHHKDGKGKGCKKPNNELSNLVTLCHIHHKLLHHQLKKIEKYGKLLKQDDSEYRYPAFRNELNKRKKKLKGYS